MKDPFLNLFAGYLEERNRTHVYVHPSGQGFMTWQRNGDEFYIVDMYVKPEARLQGIGREMADALTVMAIQMGCKYLAGTLNVGKDHAYSNDSAKAMLAYGFTFAGWNSRLNQLILTKDLPCPPSLTE